MAVIECILDALRVLVTHKLRSFLTSFGLSIGITIVIVIMSVANCVSDIVGMYYSALEEGHYCDLSISKEASSYSDCDDKKQNIKITLEQCIEFNNSDLPDDIYGIALRTPVNHEAGVYAEESLAANVIVNGISPADEHIKQLYIKTGRFISAEDCNKKSCSVVIADFLAEKLYGSQKDAISKEITVKSSDGIMFTGNIVGVYALTETTLTSTQKSNIYCAYSFVNEVFSDELEKEFSTVRIACKDENNLNRASTSYIDDFFNRYIEKDGYRTVLIPAFTQQESMKTVITSVTAIFTLIAMIIFIISGIGLMNTLLISVTERTSEIGVRKALGASDRMIIIQFLSEALVLTVLAIIGGIIIGFLTDYLIRINLNDILLSVMDSKFGYIINNTVLNVRPTAFSVVFSSLISLSIGLLFGVRPAKKAMEMQPIDALRTE